MNEKTLFLPYGEVVLHDVMGDDLAVVNAAKVSYARRSETFGQREKRLLRFLAEHGHESPFRHSILKFEVYCPLMVARQWWKYRIGSGVLEQSDVDLMEAWNESSRRYITEEEQFLLVTQFRSKPDNAKQGSGPPVDAAIDGKYQNELIEHVKAGVLLYEQAMKDGICPEQARLFLPAYGLYVRFIWTVSLAGLLHFLVQRLNDDAQFEIQQYAKDCAGCARTYFPATFDLFNIKE